MHKIFTEPAQLFFEPAQLFFEPEQIFPESAQIFPEPAQILFDNTSQYKKKCKYCFIEFTREDSVKRHINKYCKIKKKLN